MKISFNIAVCLLHVIFFLKLLQYRRKLFKIRGFFSKIFFLIWKNLNYAYCIHNLSPYCSRASFHPQQELTIWTFLAYQCYKSREGIISRKVLSEWLKIYVIWIHKIIYGPIHRLGYKAIVHTFCFLLLVIQTWW